MLYLAKAIKNSNLKNNNYVFIAFSGEEKGLWGSNYFVKNSTNLPLDKMNYMINMDMVGRMNNERQLMVSGVGTSPIFTNILDEENTYKIALKKTESGVGPTDHTSFYLENIPVLSFFTGQHEDYHKPSDDMHLLNYGGMRDISRYIYDIIDNLNDDGKLVFNKTKDESTDAPKFTVTLGVIPDYLYDGKGMRIDGVKDGKAASNAGIIKGDIVTKLGDVDVPDMMSYMKALAAFKKGDATKVIIIRDGKEMVKDVKFE
jgi:membrane-associated protease RseP (regulator of RpoE activity)